MSLRTTIAGFGEVLVTLGIVVGLYVVWFLWIDAVGVHHREADVVRRLTREFAVPGSPAAPLRRGQAIAIARIPRFGAHWALPVYEGVDRRILDRGGLAHYPGTPMPGEVGNVGIAGHRAGHGNPLIDIDKLRRGDDILIETSAGVEEYRVSSHRIVRPTDVGVLDPVPPGATRTTSGRWLTLTSCSPRYGSTNRYVVLARFAGRAAPGAG